MKKDNYTLEELTDLLHAQVVLTLINDSSFYKQARPHINSLDYCAFCEMMGSRTRAIASSVVPDADFIPTTRSLVLLWDYYMQDVYPRPMPSALYVSNMKTITTNNERLRKPTKSALHDPNAKPGLGYVRITPDQARDLKFTAEFYNHHDNVWYSCRSCVFEPEYAYRAPAHVMQQLSPPPSTSPETSKENTMSTVTTTFDASTPVTNVTLIYGKPAKNYSESDLLACVRRLDADIETYEKAATGSARIAAKVATMKAERDQIIQAFDTAANTTVGTTSDSTTV